LRFREIAPAILGFELKFAEMFKMPLEGVADQG